MLLGAGTPLHLDESKKANVKRGVLVEQEAVVSVPKRWVGATVYCNCVSPVAWVY